MGVIYVCSSGIIEGRRAKRICWIRLCLTEEWQRSFLQLIASCITWANASWAFVMKWHQNKWFYTQGVTGRQGTHPSKVGARRRVGDYTTWILGVYSGNCSNDTKFMLIVKGPKNIHLGKSSAWMLRREEPKKLQTVLLKSCWFLSLMREIHFHI